MSDKKQSNLIQGLKDHFNNTPHEQLAGDYLLHVADDDVLITAFYTRKMCDELKGD